MLQEIAMWGGIAGICVSVFAIIILFLTRKNILDILEKDVILFDKNFELKEIAISDSMKVVDELSKNKVSSLELDEKSKEIYNKLICVVSDLRVADEFYSIAIAKTTDANETTISQYKLLCRQDIGLSNKHAKLLKRTLSNRNSFSQNQFTMPSNPVVQSPIQSQPSNNQPQTYARPSQTTQTRPTQTIPVERPIAQQRPTVQPTPVRPVVQRPGMPNTQQSSTPTKPSGTNNQ